VLPGRRIDVPVELVSTNRRRPKGKTNPISPSPRKALATVAMA